MISSKKALLLGNLARGAPLADGQVVKTQTLARHLGKQADLDLEVVDTAGSNFLGGLRAILAMSKAEIVFLVPGKKLLMFFGIASRLILALQRNLPDTHMVVVGGWLAESSERRIFRWALKHVNTVSAETLSICAPLIPSKKKIWELANFRDWEKETLTGEAFLGDQIQMVFASRLTRAKGVFAAIEVLESLLAKGADVRLDVIGPKLFSAQSDLRLFEEALGRLSPAMSYLGTLEQSYLASVLARYDCCLFPSEYPGEGFPGVIVETLLSGVPAITTPHMFLPEINSRYDFGFVIEGSFVEGATSLILGRRTAEWRRRRNELGRQEELEQLLGPPAFEKWFANVRAHGRFSESDRN